MKKKTEYPLWILVLFLLVTSVLLMDVRADTYTKVSENVQNIKINKKKVSSNNKKIGSPLTAKAALNWSNTHYPTVANSDITNIENINKELRTKYMNRSVFYEPVTDLLDLDKDFVTTAGDDVVLYGNFTPKDFGIDPTYFLNNSTTVYDTMLKDTFYGIDYGYFLGSLAPKNLDSSKNEYIQVKLMVPKGTKMTRVGDMADSNFILPRESTLKYIGKNFDKNSKKLTITAELVDQDELTQATTTAEETLNAQLEYQYESPAQFIKLTPLGLNAGYVLNESSTVLPKVFEALKSGGIYSKDFFQKEVFQLTNGSLVHTDIFDERTQNDTLADKKKEFEDNFDEQVQGQTTTRRAGTYESVATFSHYTPKDNLPQVKESERIAATLLHETFHYLLYSTANFKNHSLFKGTNKTFEETVESLKTEEEKSLSFLLNDPYAEEDWQEFICEAFMAKVHPTDEISQEFKKQVPKTNRLLDNLFDTDAPTAPTALKDTEVGGTTVKFTFDHSSDNIGVAKYNVYVDGKLVKTVDTKKDSNGLSYPIPGDHQENMEVTVDDLQQITTYEFQVTAVDEAGHESAKSEKLKVTTKDIEPPQQPCCLSVQALVSNVARLIWPQPTDNHDVSEVFIYRSESSTLSLSRSKYFPQDEQVFQVAGDVNYYTDPTIVKGKTYTYYTVAVDSAGNRSKESNKVTLTTNDKDDEKDNEDNAEDVSYSQANLNWGDAFSGISASGFNIFSWLFNGVSWVFNGVTSVAGSATSSLVNLGGTSNQFVVVPVDSAGNPLSDGLQISVDAVDHSAIKAKDSELYAGQNWKKEDNFVSATDEDGKDVSLEDKRITIEGTVDTSKPGAYKVTYRFKGKGKAVESTATITVKEDKSSINTKNSELYVGQKWQKEDDFVSATDEDGKDVSLDDSRITIEGTVDTSKPGAYKVTYRFKGKVKSVESAATITVKEDKSSINTKNSELYEGQSWKKEDNFVNATDEDGKDVSLDDSRITIEGTVDTSKPGTYKVAYRFNGKYTTITSPVTITVKEDKSSITTKASELYEGQSWKKEDNFVNATDEDDKDVSVDDSRITIEGVVDTSKPGAYKVTYRFKGKGKTVESTAIITVKEDKSSIITRDSELYYVMPGQKWQKENNFVSATDEDGQAVSLNDNRISVTGTVDPSKPGTYKVAYRFNGKVKTVESTATITVKENKTFLKTKNSELYVGQEWKKEDNFVSATDKDGNVVSLDDKRMTIEGTVDTSKPGVYEVYYSYGGSVSTFYSTAKITVKEDKSSITTKASELYEGQSWKKEDNFISATDEDGNKISLDDKRISIEGTVDTSKPGVYEVYYSYGGSVSTFYSTAKITVKEDKSSITTKDSEIYIGGGLSLQSWKKEDNFISATDEDGNKISLDDKRISIEGTVDTTIAGTYEVRYSYRGSVKTSTSTAKVTVKKNKTSLKTKNSELYVGQEWKKEDNFVSATDKDGNAVSMDDSRITIEGTVDTSKPGTYEVHYIYKGSIMTLDYAAKVTVKEERPSLKTKNSTLYVGQEWKKEDSLVSAIDEDENAVSLNDSRITIEGAVDTSKPGTYKVTYRFKGKVKTVESTATITVKEDKSSITTKDSSFYARSDKGWISEYNFVNATDEEGKNVSLNDSRISVTGNANPFKAGIYKVTYRFKGKLKTVESTATITVKENYATLQTKDSTIYEGEQWKREDNFVSALDEEGHPMSYSDSRISSNNAQVDTSKPGVYHLTYTYNGVAGKIDSQFTVTVKSKNEWYSDMRNAYATSYTLYNPNESFYRTITFNNDIRSIMRGQLIGFRVTCTNGRLNFDDSKPALPFNSNGSIEIDFFKDYTNYYGIIRGPQTTVTIYAILKDSTQVNVLNFIANQ